jgi:5'-phosphate synthase pdxT subunit
MDIGVLALQGDFAEHINKLSGLGVQTSAVRLPAELDGLDGLILPGGESTTIGKLAEDYGLVEPLRTFGRRHALWGTCAGAVFLASKVGRQQPVLGLMDLTVRRNAFGRQVDSFETDLDIPALKAAGYNSAAPVRAVFIRAPSIVSAGRGVEVLARLADDTIVAARQGRWLATCFHTEITADDRLHRFFLSLASS